MSAQPDEDQARESDRLSVVLDGTLSEHVRVRAFLTRQSKSAYVRGLVEEDSRRNPVSGQMPGVESSGAAE